MEQRDETAATAVPKLLEVGAEVNVILHADLDDDEIRRAVNRWTGLNVKLVLAEHDSTEKQRHHFIRRWKAAGGTGLSEP